VYFQGWRSGELEFRDRARQRDGYSHAHRGLGGNGYPYHASPEAPQYEIKNSQTEHIAFHTSSTLTKIRG
jgi:hypothetical protein